MEIAPATMIGNHLQHPLGGPGAMLYPGKGSAWQPVVTSLPSMVDIPKESIIANTDFTTTSVIAKRRLSSKKRKKFASQQQQGSDGSSSSSSDAQQPSNSHSPMGSANGSPAVTSTTYTPPAFDKSNATDDSAVSRSTSASISSQNVMTSSHGGITSSSSTYLPHHIGGPHPPVTVSAGGVQFHHPGGQFISVAPAVSGAYHHPTVATAQTQFANNPMLSQLQQELSYRFLHANSQVNHSNHQQPQHVQQQQQQQHGFKHPGQQQPVRRGDSGQSMDTSVAPSPAVGGGVVGGGRQQQLHQRPLGFKWCYAHVHIAQQIQQQQQRAKELSSSTSSSSPSSSMLALSQSHMTQAASSAASAVAAAHHHHHHHHTQQQQHQQQQQQQQQQLALLQMYGLPAATASAVPTAATAAVPGYMAVPYSSVQDVQLRMHQLAVAANAATTGAAAAASLHPGVSLVKPVGIDGSGGGVPAESLLSLNPAGAVQMVNGLHLQAAPFAAATAHTAVPLAAVAAAPSDLNNAVFHGAASGQWMAPTVPVVGSCIVNPLQPQIMATPWVK